MAFDLVTYQDLVRRLDEDGIDYDAFARQPLRPDELRCVAYMHDIEHHTGCYLRNLLNTKAHQDPEIATFLTLWNFEEHWHGEALGRVLEAHGQPGGPSRIVAMRERLGWRMTGSPLVWMAFSAATRHFLAVHMTFGVVNEWTTQAGYSRLAAVADHPVLTVLLKRIMRQEGRHIDFYLTQAKRRLAESRAAQRTTRAMLRALWTPVGSKVMPGEETRNLVRTLFGGADGVAAVQRLERRVDSLPGLEGLHLMRRAFTDYAAA
jgi:hypothetical protein